GDEQSVGEDAALACLRGIEVAGDHEADERHGGPPWALDEYIRTSGRSFAVGTRAGFSLGSRTCRDETSSERGSSEFLTSARRGDRAGVLPLRPDGSGGAADEVHLVLERAVGPDEVTIDVLRVFSDQRPTRLLPRGSEQRVERGAGAHLVHDVLVRQVLQSG